MPSPLGIPSIDQIDLESPSTFLTFNTNSVGGGGANSVGDPLSPSNYNFAHNGLPGLDISPKPEVKPNMNFTIKTESLSPAGTSGLLSPSAIKREVDTENGCEKPFYVDPKVNCLADVNKVLAEVRAK